MSVINKMLRDLDAQHHHRQTPMHALHSTLAMAAPALSGRLRWFGVASVLVALVLTSFLWTQRSTTTATSPWALEAPAVVTTAPLQPVVMEMAEMQVEEEVLEATRKPGAMLPKSLMLKLSAQMLVPPSAQGLADTLAAKTADVATKTGANNTQPTSSMTSSSTSSSASPSLTSPNTANVTGSVTANAASLSTSAPSSATPTVPTAKLTPAASAAASSPSDSTPTAQASTNPAVNVSRHLALQENLQQAQQLWQSGSRDAAMDVLRGTLQSVERSTEVSSAETLSVLREWARMALALDRAPEVMALIKRHTGQLQGQGSADIWALQGHAAQRLGLHAEAVEAYQHALLSRPNEGRWLLASAVSLAASGQPEQAARQLQKVRAQGPVNPDILAYLKQAGVVLP